MKKIDLNIGTLIMALAVPLLIGGVSAALTVKEMASYGSMNKPPLSPPAWVFSVAWTILYILMGFASYFIIRSEPGTYNRTSALVTYGMQLVMNFMWSIIFFNWGMYLLAFIWLFIMWCLVITCTFRFYTVNRLSAYLMVPYILWLTFAAYLNFGAYVLSIDKK